MSSTDKSLFAAPETARVLPFAVMLLVPILGAKLLPNPDYWLYAIKIGVVALLVVWLRPRLTEMRWSFSWTAVGVGIGIAVFWELISRNVPGLGQLYEHVIHLTTGKPLPPVKRPESWRPLTVFKDAPGLAYFFIAVRILGRSLLVPLVEEVFYRSFVYRYIIDPKFESIPLALRHGRAWFFTAALFGAAHPDQWLAGLLCGLSYQWLVLRSGRLGDAILAHAVTNGVLSAWVIYQGTWDFS